MISRGQGFRDHISLLAAESAWQRFALAPTLAGRRYFGVQTKWHCGIVWNRQLGCGICSLRVPSKGNLKAIRSIMQDFLKVAPIPMPEGTGFTLRRVMRQVRLHLRFRVQITRFSRWE